MKRVQRRKRRACGILLLAPIMTAAAPVRAADVFLGLEAGYSSGDFGTGVTSDLSSLTLSLGATAQDYEFNGSLPYLRLGEGNAGSQSGIGDAVLRAGRNIALDAPGDTRLNLAFAVKLPTADEDKGLGTGETDVGGFASVSRRWSTVKATLSLGYIKVGDPAGLDYNDVVTYGVGLSKNFSRAGGYVSLDGRSAMMDGADAPLELSAGGFYLLDARYAVTGGVFFGLSDGSADAGANLGLLRRF